MPRQGRPLRSHEVSCPPISLWLDTTKVKTSLGVDLCEEGNHQAFYKLLIPSHLEGYQETPNCLGDAHPRVVAEPGIFSSLFICRMQQQYDNKYTTSQQHYSHVSSNLWYPSEYLRIPLALPLPSKSNKQSIVTWMNSSKDLQSTLSRTHRMDLSH